MSNNFWGNPDSFSLVLRCTTQRYAHAFRDFGQIKFSTPESWVQYEEEYGDGRGDKLEGTIAAFHLLDPDHAIPIIQKYKQCKGLLKISYGERMYLKIDRDMKLPCFCIYLQKLSLFDCPKETGVQTLKATIPYSYFRDFSDNMTPDDILKLPTLDRPALIFISDYPEFKQRLVNKLKSIGLLDNEIIEANVTYFDFDQYGRYGYWDFGQSSPMELAIKHIRFKDQNEGRFIINTDNSKVLETLKNPIEIGSLADICTISDNYFYDGMRVELTADIQAYPE